MRYTAPTTDDLQRLRNDLGLTGEQMAALFGVAGGQQWRKYTGGAQPPEMAPQMLFFGAARLALAPDELERVLTQMRAIGAEIDIASDGTAATDPGHDALCLAAQAMIEEKATDLMRAISQATDAAEAAQ